jgi:translation elongation factor EF-1beta
MTKISLSYSHQDADLAARIVDRFQQAGIGADRAELQPGDSWFNSLEQAFEDTDGVLLVLSPASLKSAWVTREYQYALSTEKPLYIVLTEALPTEDIPYGLRNLQYVDLTHDFDSNLNKLIESIHNQQTSLPGAKRLYQQTAPASPEADQTVTLEINPKSSNVDDVLEQVKKSLESGVRTIKVVNVGEE